MRQRCFGIAESESSDSVEAANRQAPWEEYRRFATLAYSDPERTTDYIRGSQIPLLRSFGTVTMKS